VKLGDDADEIDLDLTLEKYASAKEFLKKILRSFIESCGSFSIQEILVDDAVDRLVLASGGVARDFLGIFRKSINVAREREHRQNTRGPKVGIEDVNTAAGEYDTSKREEFKKDTLDDSSELEEEFLRIVTFCTDQVETNVFLRIWLTFGESSSERGRKPCRWCSKRISFRSNNVDHVSRLCLGNVASPKVSQILSAR